MLTMKCVISFYFVFFIYLAKQTNTQSVKETETITNVTYDTIVKDKDDVAIYEMDNFKQHLENAKVKSKIYEEKLNNTLRYYQVDKHEAADIRFMYMANTTYGLMQQSIYATRDRLQETRRFRQIFANDPAYKAAMIYSSLLQLKTKMDNIFSTMRNMDPHNNFVHVLVLYERMIVASVDVETFVNQLFVIQDFYKELHLKREN